MSTFVLEIINFLILVWILKRFLYVPVMNAIAERRKRLNGILQDAEVMRNEALSLKTAEEKKLAEWEAMRQTMDAKLGEEMALKRQRMLDEIEAGAEKQKNRLAAVEARKMEEWKNDIEARAIRMGSAFASKLLMRLASPELDDKLYTLFMEDLGKLDHASLSASLGRHEEMLEVASAYPLSQDKRNRLLAEMEKIAGRALKSSFTEDRGLVCGLRVAIGAWVIHANIADELAFFRKVDHEA